MTSQEIHDMAINEFELIAKPLQSGQSFWTQKTSNTRSVRIVRASHDAHEQITELKLAIASAAQGVDVFLEIPFSTEKVRQAIADEMRNSTITHIS